MKWSSLFLENVPWKLLALGMAVVIWWLVASEPELATFATVRLEYKNLPDEIELGSEPVTSITLELRGPASELRSVGDGGIHPAVILDMSGVQPGERTYVINRANVQLSRGVRLIRTIPPEVRFQFELRAHNTVPVTVRFTGEGKNGYVVAQKWVNPPDLRILGPASHVARVKFAETDPVDISAVVGTSDFRVNAYVGDPFVRIDSTPQVTVTVNMKKK